MERKNYIKLLLMSGISFCIMYAVMFLNVDDLSHIYLSMTRMYMSLLMVSPMLVLMLLMMNKMYTNRKWNIAIHSSAVLVFALSLLFLRKQILIGDREYIKAMIPHHSSAILTSKNADLSDPDVKKLSESIIESQEREIREMKMMLDTLE